LLSFAQFEREVTAERIRDKIAASKQKGLWMGGICPLGYDKHPDPQMRTLVANNAEAETVRTLFDLYDQYGCLRVIENKARDRRLKSKAHTFATGRTAGGRPFSRGQIYYILRNPLYIGDIRHKDKTYPGQHPAIIDHALWDRVQEKLKRLSQKKRGNHIEAQSTPFPLTGKLWDETGDRLTPTSTNKGSRKHRYYVSNRLIAGGKDNTAWRISAKTLEKKIIDMVADHLVAHVQRASLFAGVSLSSSESLQVRLTEAMQALKEQSRPLLRIILASVLFKQDQVEIKLDRDALAKAIDTQAEMINPDALAFSVSWQIKKRGVERKIVIGDEARKPDLTLVKALAQAHRWMDQIRQGKSLKTIAAEVKVTPAYVRARSQLALLSPKIQEAIIGGTLDPKFTTNHIMGLKIPMDWAKQESLFLQN
jgi:site-specific DNA recombinase